MHSFAVLITASPLILAMHQVLVAAQDPFAHSLADGHNHTDNWTTDTNAPQPPVEEKPSATQEQATIGLQVADILRSIYHNPQATDLPVAEFGPQRKPLELIPNASPSSISDASISASASPSPTSDASISANASPSVASASASASDIPAAASPEIEDAEDSLIVTPSTSMDIPLSTSTTAETTTAETTTAETTTTLETTTTETTATETSITASEVSATPSPTTTEIPAVTESPTPEEAEEVQEEAQEDAEEQAALAKAEEEKAAKQAEKEAKKAEKEAEKAAEAKKKAEEEAAANIAAEQYKDGDSSDYRKGFENVLPPSETTPGDDSSVVSAGEKVGYFGFLSLAVPALLALAQ